MRIRFQLLVGLLCLAITGLLSSPVLAQLNVVASLPDYGVIAKEVGGDAINLTSLARGTEDAHFVNPRPSYIRILNQADMLIENGSEMEVGWLPPLIEASRNPKLVQSFEARLGIMGVVWRSFVFVFGRAPRDDAPILRVRGGKDMILKDG